MNVDNWNIWNRLSFKTTSYRKNFDMLIDNDNIISEHVGVISMLNIGERTSPTIIGEYTFSVWNINLTKINKINTKKLVQSHYLEDTYDEALKLIKNRELNINSYHKVIFIHSLILRKDFRKREITEEFIETIYRDYHDDNIAIIMLCRPIQDNKINAEHYFNDKYVQTKDAFQYHQIPAMKYYSLDELMVNKDTEINEYKLFNIAKKCGFNRIGESYLFMFDPASIIERLQLKQGLSNKLNTKSVS